MFRGLFLVVDGYQAYGTARARLAVASASRCVGCTRAARLPRACVALCWARARRMLVEGEESYPEASEALDLIGEMFLIERDLPDWRCITDDGLRARAGADS